MCIIDRRERDREREEEKETEKGGSREVGREAEAKLPLREEDGKESELRPEAEDQPASADGEGVGVACLLKGPIP